MINSAQAVINIEPMVLVGVSQSRRAADWMGRPDQGLRRPCSACLTQSQGSMGAAPVLCCDPEGGAAVWTQAGAIRRQSWAGVGDWREAVFVAANEADYSP